MVKTEQLTNDGSESLLKKAKIKVANYLKNEGFDPRELLPDFLAQMREFGIMTDTEIAFALDSEPVLDSEQFDKVLVELDQFNTSEVSIRLEEDVNSVRVVILSPKIN